MRMYGFEKETFREFGWGATLDFLSWYKRTGSSLFKHCCDEMSNKLKYSENSMIAGKWGH